MRLVNPPPTHSSMSNDMTWAIQLVWNLHDADIMENGKNWTNERDAKTQKKESKTASRVVGLVRPPKRENRLFNNRCGLALV